MNAAQPADERLRVLFVCPFVPWPLNSGGRIRTYHLLQALGKRAHIDLLLVREPGPIEEAEAALAPLVARVDFFERAAPGAVMRWSRPKIERWFHSPDLRASLARAIAGTGHPGEPDQAPYDLVHLDELLLARTLPAGNRVPVVQHHHKIDSVLYDLLSTHQGPARHFDLWKLRQLEREAARRIRHHLVCSEEDAAILRRRYPDLELGVVPSGFDPQHFRPSPDGVQRERDLLVFVGSMSYGPNVDAVVHFVREVLPRVRVRRPAAHLEIVGLDPAPEVLALAGPGVKVVGGVPDVRPYFERASAVVVPLRIGGGTRLKIVEALAMGAPVVSTPVGAEGLGLTHGEELLLARAPGAFAQAILQLLERPEWARDLGARGKVSVENRFRWDVLALGALEHWKRAASGVYGVRG